MQWNALSATGICSCSSAYRRFREWAEAGVFLEFWRRGLLAYDQEHGIEWEWLALDGALGKAPLGGEETGPNRQALQGILFVLYTGIAWRHLPPELGFGGGSTCHRRMDEWQRAGVWERLHEVLLAVLRACGEIEWSRAVADSSHVQAKKGAPRRARARLIEPGTAPSITFS